MKTRPPSHLLAHLLLLAGLGAMASDGAGMPGELAEFDWRARISGPLQTNLMHKIRLPGDVFDGMRSFPLDVRVVDDAGEVWPSMIWVRQERESVMPVGLRPVGDLKTDKANGALVRRFRVEPDRITGEMPRHNRVILAARGVDFMCRVEVFGGASEEALTRLGGGMIIEQAVPPALRIRAVDYPETRVRMLEVRVLPDDRPEAGTPLDWRSTEVVHAVEPEDAVDLFMPEVLDRPEDEPPGEGLQVFLSTGARNRPLYFLELDPVDFEGVMPVRISGRNEASAKWRWITDGAVVVLAGLRQTRIELNRADFLLLKVEFLVDDADVDMRVSAAGGVPHYLMFIPKSDQRAYVYFGSERYQLPQASFVRGVDAESVANAKEAELARRQINPAQMVELLDRYWRTMLILLLAVVGSLVVVLAIRLARRRYFS